MTRRELSILIPARNEMWLRKTVEGILECSGERTEVIVVLDGEWADPPIAQHDRVTVLANGEAVGQRAATNQAARLSEAKYVMKCDAHVAFSAGFDEVLLAAMEGHDDWTIVPKMFNLHAFDWLCEKCAAEGVVLEKKMRPGRLYQSPSGRGRGGPRWGDTRPCPACGAAMERDVLWRAKPSPETTAMRFDRELRFQYWGEHKPRQVWEDECAETMSLLGACWMLTRERYWALNISDEAHGSWGQQGTEVACKSWLSGGRLMCCRAAWFAHLFRTQGGDFGFPYKQSGQQLKHAREYSRRLWIENEWEGAIRPLSWLIGHFAPVPEWEDYEVSGPRKAAVFYTDNRLPLRIARTVQKQLQAQRVPITSASLKPMPHLGQNVVVAGRPGVETMFRQILAGIEASDADYLFLCEHDVLYHPAHFAFVPPLDDVFYYNVNVWKVRLEDGHAVRVDDCRQTSGLCAGRELLLAHYRERVRRVEAEGFTRAMGFEPGTHRRKERVDDSTSEVWRSAFPNLDIRHAGALTPTRWSPDEFRNQRYAHGWAEAHVTEIDGWGDLSHLFGRNGAEA